MKSTSCLALSKIASLSLLLFLAHHRSIQAEVRLEALPSKESLGAMDALGEAIALAVTYYDPISTEQLRLSIDEWAKEHKAQLGVLNWMRRSYDRAKAGHESQIVRPLLIQSELTTFNSSLTKPGITTDSHLETPKRWTNVEEFLADRNGKKSVKPNDAVPSYRYGPVMISTRVIDRGGLDQRWNTEVSSKVGIKVTWEIVNVLDGTSRLIADEGSVAWANGTWEFSDKK